MLCPSGSVLPGLRSSVLPAYASYFTAEGDWAWHWALDSHGPCVSSVW